MKSRHLPEKLGGLAITVGVHSLRNGLNADPILVIKFVGSAS